LLALAGLPHLASAAERVKIGRLNAVPFTMVRINDAFWGPRIETNRKQTIGYDFRKCEVTGRISNFAKAAGRMPGKFEGIYFNDSDVYKVIEGAAYSLQVHPDPALDKYLDELIDTIAAAQQKDGYLNTYYTLAEPGKRWTNLPVMHELYCAGHLIEAAVAHFEATKKRELLDVAIRLADHIDATFGPGKKIGVPGHQEIELALVKLYRTTGEERYLKLAKFFLDERGRTTGGRKPAGEYSQDHKPVVDQDKPVGHSVRAGYMYCGMTDVAALTGDTGYVAALDRIWENLVGRKMYITGGIGSRSGGEAFGDDFELPNKTAYNETCAAIANIFWNHRMGLLKGDAKYFDVMELDLYNGFLSGVSLSGQEFHYPNPLETDGKRRFNFGSTGRQGWFDCSCCPVNVVRVFPQLGGYMYATDDEGIYVNLYAASTTTIPFKGQQVKLVQKTNYPWDGRVRIEIDVPEAAEFDICLRQPFWCGAKGPIQGDLYGYLNPAKAQITPDAKIHEEATTLKVSPSDNGYMRFRGKWKKGDWVECEFTMPAQRVVSNERVRGNVGRVAIMRGPIVYCLEGADNNGRALNLALPRDARFTPEHRPDLLGGVTVLKGQAISQDDGDKRADKKIDVTAIPYYAWNHRGPGEMTVWIPQP
jgi:DUF1680 family protein